MKWKCVGNGQLHQVQLQEVAGALNCMHDQQILLGGGGDEMNGEKTVVRRLTPL